MTEIVSLAQPRVHRISPKTIIGLGKIRWVVEQSIAHFHQFKRLAIR